MSAPIAKPAASSQMSDGSASQKRMSSLLRR